MKNIRIVLFLLTTIYVIFLCGCWDMREINELGLVTAVGIDKAEGTNRYVVTVQIANQTAENTSEGKSNGTVWIGSKEGASVFDATRKLVKISSRRIMWAHNTVVIIGESLAKEGIIPVVDFFTHNPELRMKTAVVVANGNAKDYVTAKIGLENPPGISFISLEGYRSLTAESVESHMLEVSSTLKSEYGNPRISRISMKKALIQSESDKGGSGKDSETVDLEGIAVFKKDKMIGSLSPEDSRGVAWILNQTKNTLVTVTDPQHENRSVSVETRGVKAKIETYVINGMLEISIHISGKGNIVEEDGSTSKGINEVKENIAGLINKKIEEEIKSSLDIVQKKYMVDCLGLAQKVHVQNDREWHEGLDEKWNEVFPQIPVTVSVDINIETSVLNQEPMKVY